MREKQPFTGASQDENLSGVAPGKIPEYLIASWHGKSDREAERSSIALLADSKLRKKANC